MYSIPLFLVVQGQQNTGGDSNISLQPSSLQADSTTDTTDNSQQLPLFSSSNNQGNRSGHLSDQATSSQSPAIASSASDQDSNGFNTLQQLQLALAQLQGQVSSSLPSSQISHNNFTQVPATRPEQSSRPSTTDREQLFPFVLHGLLDDADKANQTSIISWSTDGKSFRLHNAEVFASKILCSYFPDMSWREFCARLDDWGFVFEQESFFHPCFVRGEPTLCRHMRCGQRRQGMVSPIGSE
jgi:hypothetical protein